MELESSRFGKINFKRSEIISMVRSLLGFEEFKRFLIVAPENQKPFIWLQAIDNPGLAFLAIDPLIIRPDYKINISQKDLAILESRDNKDFITYLLVTIPKGQIEAMTANLQAPIVISRSSMNSIQLIINDSGFVTQYPIFKAVFLEISGNV